MDGEASWSACAALEALLVAHLASSLSRAGPSARACAGWGCGVWSARDPAGRDPSRWSSVGRVSFDSSLASFKIYSLELMLSPSAKMETRVSPLQAVERTGKEKECEVVLTMVLVITGFVVCCLGLEHYAKQFIYFR